MSVDPPRYDGSLRRTQSTGSIPTRDIQRPTPARISISNRYSETNPIQSNAFMSSGRASSSTIAPAPHSAGPTVGRIASSPSTIVEFPEEERHSPTPNAEQILHLQILRNRSLYTRAKAFFGYGIGASRARRSLVSLLSSLGWGFTQFVVIITMIALSARLQSPTAPGLSEWHACSKPLGVWSCLWLIRDIFSCFLAYWSYVRDRQTQSNRRDVESSNTDTSLAHPTSPGTQRPFGTTTSHPSHHHPDPDAEPPLPYSQLYSKLTTFSSISTLAWFLTAHILEYTSVNTCRQSSPHLWWLVFGILCIMYLMVLEVVLLGFVVFIIAPILFLIWNILLICLGRHPYQNPTRIKPEIDKLPKSVVECIPLVMYIPPPPDELGQEPITIPPLVHSYPPKPPPLPKKRFKLLRNIASKRKLTVTEGGAEDAKIGKTGVKGAPQAWEDHWEQGDYPFVRLEGNRAVCAICLMDFEEPKRIGGIVEKQVEAEEGSSNPQVEEVPVENITEEEREEQLRLTDAGEGAQPLRLLACGHVFHKTCLDPWLTDVSGRCPVCQRPVEIPEEKKKSRNNRRQDS